MNDNTFWPDSSVGEPITDIRHPQNISKDREGILCRPKIPLNISLIKLQNKPNGFTDATIVCSNGSFPFHFHVLQALWPKSSHQAKSVDHDSRIIDLADVTVEEMYPVIFLLYMGKTMMRIFTANSSGVLAGTSKELLYDILERIGVETPNVRVMTPLNSSSKISGNRNDVLEQFLLSEFKHFYVRCNHIVNGKVQQILIDVNGIGHGTEGDSKYELSPPVQRVDMYFCTRCLELFSSLREAENHIDQTHGHDGAEKRKFNPVQRKSYTCQVLTCPTTIVGITEFLLHCKYKHGIRYAEHYKLEPSPQCLKCTQCDSVFENNLPIFIRHICECPPRRIYAEFYARRNLPGAFQATKSAPCVKKWYEHVDIVSLRK